MKAPVVVLTILMSFLLSGCDNSGNGASVAPTVISNEDAMKTTATQKPSETGTLAPSPSNTPVGDGDPAPKITVSKEVTPDSGATADSDKPVVAP